MKTFTLDYSKWRSGGNGDNKTGNGPTSLLNEHGFMCCLGQFSVQDGFEKEYIVCKTRPGNFSKKWPIFTVTSQVYCHDQIETDLTRNLILVNDDRQTTPEIKIGKIRELLAEAGIELNVINYPK